MYVCIYVYMMRVGKLSSNVVSLRRTRQSFVDSYLLLSLGSTVGIRNRSYFHFALFSM